MGPLASAPIRDTIERSRGTMRREKCHDCKVEAPETNTEYTLISARYGWRVVRSVDAAGDTVLEWRCPACWKRYKEAPRSVAPSTAAPRRPAVRTQTGRVAAVAAGEAFDKALEALREREKKP
jgi:hypothetical protein